MRSWHDWCMLYPCRTVLTHPVNFHARCHVGESTFDYGTTPENAAYVSLVRLIDEEEQEEHWAGPIKHVVRCGDTFYVIAKEA